MAELFAQGGYADFFAGGHFRQAPRGCFFPSGVSCLRRMRNADICRRSFSESLVNFCFSSTKAVAVMG